MGDSNSRHHEVKKEINNNNNSGNRWLRMTVLSCVW